MILDEATSHVDSENEHLGGRPGHGARRPRLVAPPTDSPTITAADRSSVVGDPGAIIPARHQRHGGSCARRTLAPVPST
ncbi:MAG: hypothetical protein V9G12_04020 [Microthrixaceae bacterium]